MLHSIAKKKLEASENKQMNNTITEMKNTLEGINSRINRAVEQISELEHRLVEITIAEQNKERKMIALFTIART